MFHNYHFSSSQSNPVSLLAAQSVDPPVHPPKKRKGRPPGSKNKPKDNNPSRGRGRGGRGRGKASVDTQVRRQGKGQGSWIEDSSAEEIDAVLER